MYTIIFYFILLSLPQHGELVSYSVPLKGSLFISIQVTNIQKVVADRTFNTNPDSQFFIKIGDRKKYPNPYIKRPLWLQWELELNDTTFYHIKQFYSPACNAGGIPLDVLDEYKIPIEKVRDVRIFGHLGCMSKPINCLNESIYDNPRFDVTENKNWDAKNRIELIHLVFQ